MGANSAIEWTDHTFNPWIGCTKVSPGCKHCYAEVNTFTRRERANGRELWGPKGERHVTSDGYWRKPLAWNREAEAAGERRRVFCASLADVFEDRRDVWEARQRLFALIAETPWLDWQILTKRPENVRRFAPVWYSDGFPPNVWIGTSVEDQQRADERIPHLLQIPAAVRFLSCEPLLGPVDLRLGTTSADGLHWVIVGGESGPDARPMAVWWARRVVDQCREMGVPVFVKQLGARPGVPSCASMDCTHPDCSVEWLELKDPKGGDPSEWPAGLRVREMPESVVEAVGG